jgi:hypothetical protein
MRDFTLKTYKVLLESILDAGYSIQTFEDFLREPIRKVVVLRHDVDERPENALKMAELECSLNICATYYFRIVKISNKPEIIRKIASLGHEIGYHYEDLSMADGEMDSALLSFQENLEYFRQFYPVSTVCQHGSSLSQHDNKSIWEHVSLKDFRLIGEPYLSVDYSKVFYVSDTARRWDGMKYSVRDKVPDHFYLRFKNTREMIRHFKERKFPDTSIVQCHTLWTDNLLEWYWLEYREFVRNRLKVFSLKLPILRNLFYSLTKFSSR